MKVRIRPGQEITIFRKFPGVDRLAPIVTMVSAVNRAALTVPEGDSINGLAKIIVHGTSLSKGEYWYEYTDKKEDGCSFDIKEIKTGGAKLFCGQFIED